MKTTESLDLRGRLRLRLHHRTGAVREHLADNHIVLSGRDLVSKLFIAEAIQPISHIAVGTGTSAVTAADSALELEVFRKPIRPIDPQVDVTTTNDDRKKVMVSVELDFTEGNDALTEAGIFNADTDGVMYNRVVFPAINKTSDFKLTLLWEILF